MSQSRSLFVKLWLKLWRELGWKSRIIHFLVNSLENPISALYLCQKEISKMKINSKIILSNELFTIKKIGNLCCCCNHDLVIANQYLTSWKANSCLQSTHCCIIFEEKYRNVLSEKDIVCGFPHSDFKKILFCRAAKETI